MMALPVERQHLKSLIAIERGRYGALVAAKYLNIILTGMMIYNAMIAGEPGPVNPIRESQFISVNAVNERTLVHIYPYPWRFERLAPVSIRGCSIFDY